MQPAEGGGPETNDSLVWPNIFPPLDDRFSSAMGNGQDTLSSSVDLPSEESPRHSTLKTHAASDSVGEPRVEQTIDIDKTLIDKERSPLLPNVRPLNTLSGVDKPKADQRAVERTAAPTVAINIDKPTKEQVSSYSKRCHHIHSSKTVSINEPGIARLNDIETVDIDDLQVEQSLPHSTDKSSTETFVGVDKPKAKQKSVQNVRETAHIVAINTMVEQPQKEQFSGQCHSKTSGTICQVEHQINVKDIFNIDETLKEQSPLPVRTFADVDEPLAATQTVSLTTSVVTAVNKPPKEQSPFHSATDPSSKTLSISEPSSRHQNVLETVQSKAPNKQSPRHSTKSCESHILDESCVKAITGDVVEPVKPLKEWSPHQSAIRSSKTFFNVLDEPQAEQIAVLTLPEQKTEPPVQKTLAVVKEQSSHDSDITTSKKIGDETKTVKHNVQETTTVVAAIDDLPATDQSLKPLSIDEYLTVKPLKEQTPHNSTTRLSKTIVDILGEPQAKQIAVHPSPEQKMEPTTQKSFAVVKEQSSHHSESSKTPCSTVELEAEQGAVQDIKESSTAVVDINEPSGKHGSLHSATSSKMRSLDEPHVNVKEVDLDEPQLKQSHSHTTTDQFSKKLHVDNLKTKRHKVDIEEPRLKEESLHLSTSKTLSVDEPQPNERNLKVKVKAVGPSTHAKSDCSGPVNIAAASELQDASKETETTRHSVDTAAQVDMVTYSADVPITRKTISSSAARQVNIAVEELQEKSKPKGMKTETTSEPEMPLTSLDTASPSSKSSLGDGDTTSSQDSPRRISRKKKQGQTRLKQCRGESQ